MFSHLYLCLFFFFQFQRNPFNIFCKAISGAELSRFCLSVNSLSFLQIRSSNLLIECSQGLRVFSFHHFDIVYHFLHACRVSSLVQVVTFLAAFKILLIFNFYYFNYSGSWVRFVGSSCSGLRVVCLMFVFFLRQCCLLFLLINSLFFLVSSFSGALLCEF